MMKWSRATIFSSMLGVVILGCSRPSANAPSQEPTDSSLSSEAADTPDDRTEEESSVGLAVGEKAPEFVLKDQNGAARSLSSLLESGPVAMVFYRSADW